MKLDKLRAENPTDFELIAAGNAFAPGHSFGIHAQAAGDIYVIGENGNTIKFTVDSAGALSGVIASEITAATTVDIVALFGKI